jgi:hypothetical protein
MASYLRRYSTMKSIFWWSAVSMISLTSGQHYQWYRWPLVGGVNDTDDQGGRSVTFWLDPDPHSEKSGAGSDLNLALSQSGTADQWWAVSITPLTIAGWCQWHCRFNYANFVQKLSGVIDTSDHWSAVSMTPLTGGGWCQWHHWPKLTPLPRVPQSLACFGCF